MSVTPSDVGSRHRRWWGAAASCVLAAAMACSFPDVTFAPADAGSPVSPAPPADDDAIAPDQSVDSSLMARAPDADDDAPPFAPDDAPETIDVSAASVEEETGSSPAPFDAADERIDDGAPEGGIADAVDSPAGDARPIVPPCPAACSGGCGSAGVTCTILISRVTTAPVNCPPGLACAVHCAGTNVCVSTINCAPGFPCTVVCSGHEACSRNLINGSVASSLCVQCIASGIAGCNSATCSGTCSLQCVGGCGGSCSSCASVPSCP